MNRRALIVVIILGSVPSLVYPQATKTFATSAEFDGPYTLVPEVTVMCNGGIPLVQTAAAGTTFTVNELIEGAVCTVEQSQDDGYSTSYLADGIPSDDNCFIQISNSSDYHECYMLNTLEGPIKPAPQHGSINGYESIEKWGRIPPFSSGIVEAHCSESKTVLGGGYSLLSGGDWTLVSLGPSPDGEGYFIEMSSNGEEPQEVLVTAICANVKLKTK